MHEIKYILGLDIGIGSVGWALIADDGVCPRIERVGVHLFNSGERIENNKQIKTCQKTRGKRGVRRVARRRKHRKQRLKHYLARHNLATLYDIDVAMNQHRINTYELRVKGLDQKLSPEEIAAVLIFMCNHRGFKFFYEEDLETANGKKQGKEIQKACCVIDELFEQGSYRTIGEMICRDPRFKNRSYPNNQLPVIRNHAGNYSYMINRKYLVAEVEALLMVQSKYYEVITSSFITDIANIIFSQRDFEDGPGDSNGGKGRRYKGFAYNIGPCRFYPLEQRGFRHTVIGDMFTFVNILSQYSYSNPLENTNCLPPDAAVEIVQCALENGGMTIKNLENVLDRHGVKVFIPEKATKISKGGVFLYLDKIKKVLEKAGYEWNDWLEEEQFDLANPSMLHKLGEVMSLNITPGRKRTALEAAGLVNQQSIEVLMPIKMSGTTGVGYHYMIDAIRAFQKGELYGNYQARIIKKLDENLDQRLANKVTKLPPISDPVVGANPVVMRSINETRKIVNAIVGEYGRLAAVNIEISTDLSKSFKQRNVEIREQKENEKANISLKEQCSDVYSKIFPGKEPDGRHIERFRLYKIQEGKCMYTGQPIQLEQLFSKMYEVDHIIPQSMVLDNTIHNKVLVCTAQNQNRMNNKTPLQLITDPSKREEFKVRAESMLKNGKSSKKKYEYLVLPDLNDLELVNGWKSRNINDTRYLTRYMVNYLQANLSFNSNSKYNVYGVKSAVVARFRRMWLRGTDWEDKDRGKSHLHHAIDALVVASLSPAYIQVATDYLVLRSIYHSNGKRENEEYRQFLAECIDKMEDFYGFSRTYTERLLSDKRGRIPAILPNLTEEVKVRFIDDPAREAEFRHRVQELYGNSNFSDSLTMPLVTYKPERRYRGEIVSSDLPKPIKSIDGVLYKTSRLAINDVTCRLWATNCILKDDADMRSTVERIFLNQDERYSIGQYLKESELPEFRTDKGRLISLVTKLEAADSFPSTVKVDARGNISLYETSRYYCAEIYRDFKGKLRIRGIRYVDVAKRNKKLYLKVPYPGDYKSHVMYLFQNDYIRLWDVDGKEKFAGYYRSIKSVGRRLLYYQDNRPAAERYLTVSPKDTVKKYSINMLGGIKGEIKCGEPLSLLPEKD